MSTKRIINEVREIEKFIKLEPIDNHRFLDIQMIDDDIKHYEVTFIGPKETPYEEIINTLSINIPEDYPHKSPSIKFLNKIYHPNISQYDGSICLDILKENWKPVYSLRTILMSIISLLSDPNPDSPLNGEAAALYKNGKTSKEDRRKYTKMILSVGDKNIKKN